MCFHQKSAETEWRPCPQAWKNLTDRCVLEENKDDLHLAYFLDVLYQT